MKIGHLIEDLLVAFVCGFTIGIIIKQAMQW